MSRNMKRSGCCLKQLNVRTESFIIFTLLDREAEHEPGSTGIL